MARIAWDNVSAPDFRGTADGLRDFASMWGGAMDSMGQGVKDFENAKGNQVSNQIQLALAQAPDAAAAQKLIQSGQVGGYDLNSGRIASLVDPNTIRALQDTPGNLIARASNQVKLQGDQRDFTQRANMDAQQAAIQSALTKSSSRDQATRDQGLAELGQLQANFGAGNFNNLLRDATSQGSSAVSTATSQNSLDQNQNGYNIDSIAAGIYQRARVASAGNPTDLANQLQRELANLDQSNPMYGRIAARINDLAGAGGSGMGGGGGLGGAGGGGAMASGGLSNLGLMTGGASLPDSIKTVGDFVNQKDAILAAGRDKAGVGHTNTGVYQLGSDTVAQFAPAALGAGWEKADFRSFDVQDKIAHAVFDWAKTQPNPGEALAQRWVTLNPAEAKTMLAQGWEASRGIIAQRESSTDIATLQANAVETNAASAVESGSQDPTNIAERLIAQASNKTDPRSIAAGLAAKHKGLLESDASNAIQHIIDQGHDFKSPGHPDGINLNAAQAAEIFEDASRGRNLGDVLTSWARTGNRAGEGMQLRDKIVQESIAKYASPQVIRTVTRNAERTREQALNAQSLAGVQSTWAEYQRIASTRASTPGYDKDGYLLKQAEQRLRSAATKAGANEGQLRAFTDPAHFGDASLLKNLKGPAPASAPASDPAARVAAAAKPKAAPVAPAKPASAAELPTATSPQLAELQRQRAEAVASRNSRNVGMIDQRIKALQTTPTVTPAQAEQARQTLVSDLQAQRQAAVNSRNYRSVGIIDQRLAAAGVNMHPVAVAKTAPDPSKAAAAIAAAAAVQRQQELASRAPDLTHHRS